MKTPPSWLAAAVLLFASPASSQSADQPNVIVILADDLGYGDLGCYGHPKFKTPRLDRMAAEGARLTAFNTPMPFCAPTRASLLTGRYPWRCGMNGNPAPDGGPAADALALPSSEITLAQLFQQAGYATGMVGKWHLGHKTPEQMPTGRGFDEYFGILYSNDMRPVELIEGTKAIEYPVVQATLTRRQTARAVDFIERNRSNPFFLYLAHVMPHKPLAAAEEFYQKSDAGLYGDVLMDLDTGIGEVLDKLREAGIDDNTFVVFTSDNGPWFGGRTGGLRGMKGSTYEGGYRVPCIARWPGKIPAGHVNDSPAVMMDLFATVLNIAGLAPPTEVVIDGRDILPLFTTDAKSPHPAVFGQQGPRLGSIRDERWKLHVLPPRDNFASLDKPGERWIDPRGPDGVTILAPCEQYQPSEHPGLVSGVNSAAMQLFDLQADPGEQTDVAADHPAVVDRLKALYDAMNRDVPEPPASVQTQKKAAPPAASPPPAAERFEVAGRPAILYASPRPAEGQPWLWYAPALNGGLSIVQRTFYAGPFLDAGIALAGYDLGEVRGSPASTARFTAFYEEMVRRGYSARPILLGQSRGGLMMLAWAAAYPEKVGAFVGIYPVCNLASWPLKNSKAATLADFGLPEKELLARLSEFNPVDRLDGLLAADVPMFSVHGDSDTVVPLEENSGLLKERYSAGGGKITLKVIPGEGHKVGPAFFECPELVEFVLSRISPHLQVR